MYFKDRTYYANKFKQYAIMALLAICFDLIVVLLMVMA